MRNQYELPKVDPDEVEGRVLAWILVHDFPLPRLNRTKYRHFWYAGKENHAKLKEKAPKYKSGKFTETENIVILKRLQVSFY